MGFPPTMNLPREEPTPVLDETPRYRTAGQFDRSDAQRLAQTCRDYHLAELRACRAIQSGRDLMHLERYRSASRLHRVFLSPVRDADDWRTVEEEIMIEGVRDARNRAEDILEFIGMVSGPTVVISLEDFRFLISRPQWQTHFPKDD